MVSAAGPLIGGTFAFIALALLTAAGGLYLVRSRRLNKDEGQIFCISTIIAWFCMWLMWICTWLHQWHPIIFPTQAHRPGASTAVSSPRAAATRHPCYTMEGGSQRLCLARTLRDTQAFEPGDLALEAGSVVVVMRALGKSHFYGYLTTPDAVLGVFPQDAVEVIQGTVESSPAYTVSSPAKGSGEEPDADTLALFDADNVFTARAVAALRGIAVPQAERKLSMDGTILKSWYTVEILVGRRTVHVEKRYSEFRKIDAVLRARFPDRYAAPAAAGTAEAFMTINLHSPGLMRAKPTSATMEARRHALQAYLQQAVRDPALCSALLSAALKRNMGAAANVPTLQELEEAAAAAEAEAEEEAAMAAAPPAPAPAAAGKAAPGRAMSQDDAMLAAAAAQLRGGAAAPAPAAPASSGDDEDDEIEREWLASLAAAEAEKADLASVPPPAITYEAPGVTPGFAPGATRDFSLDSMDAFDALMEDGFAVVLSDGETCATAETHAAAGARPGQRAAVKFTSIVWDGSSASASWYEAVSLADFAVGDMRDDRLPKGLHAAMARVPVGEPVTIVLSAEQGYGKAGKPPHVRENAQLVYFLTLISVGGEPRNMDAFTAAAAEAAAPAPEDDGFKFAGRNTGGSKVTLGGPPAAAPPRTGGMHGGANGMPTPEEAERAFKAYLTSMGGEGGAGGGAGGSEEGRSKGGFLKGLFKGKK